MRRLSVVPLFLPLAFIPSSCFNIACTVRFRIISPCKEL
jgi:hypothetical protein